MGILVHGADNAQNVTGYDMNIARGSRVNQVLNEQPQTSRPDQAPDGVLQLCHATRSFLVVFVTFQLNMCRSVEVPAYSPDLAFRGVVG